MTSLGKQRIGAVITRWGQDNDMDQTQIIDMHVGMYFVCSELGHLLGCLTGQQRWNPPNTWDKVIEWHAERGEGAKGIRDYLDFMFQDRAKYMRYSETSLMDILSVCYKAEPIEAV